MKWTPEQITLAMKMLDEGASDADFRAAIGRSKQCAIEKRKRAKYLSAPAPGMHRVRKRRARTVIVQQEPFIVPLEVWVARARRLASPPRDLVGAICGDPRVGYSALDRRGAQA